VWLLPFVMLSFAGKGELIMPPIEFRFKNLTLEVGFSLAEVHEILRYVGFAAFTGLPKPLAFDRLAHTLHITPSGAVHLVTPDGRTSYGVNVTREVARRLS
jgi:hypothetical protein